MIDHENEAADLDAQYERLDNEYTSLIDANTNTAIVIFEALAVALFVVAATLAVLFFIYGV